MGDMVQAGDSNEVLFADIPADITPDITITEPGDSVNSLIICDESLCDTSEIDLPSDSYHEAKSLLECHAYSVNEQFCAEESLETGLSVPLANARSKTNHQAKLQCIPSTQATKLAIKTTVQKCNSKPHPCGSCHKQFSTLALLQKHERIHKNNRPYECDECHRRFTQKCTLITHMRTHTGLKPYRCQYCEKCFTTSSNLNAHIKIHTGEKPYACTYCKKTFRLRGDLKKHITIHTGVRAYTCAECGNSFKQASQLRQHEKIHVVSLASHATAKREAQLDVIHHCLLCDVTFDNSAAAQHHVSTTHPGESLADCIEMICHMTR